MDSVRYIHRSGRADTCQFRPQPAAASLHHMTLGAVAFSEEDALALARSPATGVFVPALAERRYATSAQVSLSSNALDGIWVPGTPSLMVRKISASLPPCTQRPERRLGPRPPPPALRPWHGEQLARKSEAPSLMAAGSPARGFFGSSAGADATPASNPIEMKETRFTAQNHDEGARPGSTVLSRIL